ncbi:MAG: penicillin acylase family protein [Hydrogenophaga sp.]|uniref:penicillin acylase family protein n=1 Tax=Hydrogenophaga sp. TaxID=1904254 RepID=UPI0027360EDD|nr:penicillin acylase family protein [Hydrogenophaga sp.]MDP3349947.1 penicillin acylase family protein [Hydrogenophaga sp.]
MSTTASLRASLALACSLLFFSFASQAADIVRDKFGVPHIYGDSVPDVFFGYGYTVAEDRLFQLEMRRRQATGQLAAVLGAETSGATGGAAVNIVALDLQTRESYDPANLMSQFKGLAPDEQALIQAYLDGVNARIKEVLDSGGKLLPRQFVDVWGERLARTELRSWTLDDMLAAATNALTSYSSHTTAQQNAALYAALRKKYPNDFQRLFDTMLWINDPYAPTTREDNAVIQLAEADLSTTRLASAPAPTGAMTVLPLGAPQFEPEATTTSMALLVGKARTGGKSLQLNGPQPGWFQPGYFYTVGLHAPGYDVVGHAPGGLLAVTTGDNGHIAWGSTSAGGDHTTIFQESLSGDKRAYAFQDKFLPVRTEKVSIQIKEVSPREFVVNRTHRGPFTTSLDAPMVYSKQNLWKGHELTSVMAWQRATQAKNWETFHAEGQRMAMGYNWFYSDKDGNIGWLFGGHFPADLSSRDGDPRLPAIGKQGDRAGRSYAGEIFLYNPPSGYLVNWNNKPQKNYANRDLHIPRWSQGDRANILGELMQERAKNPSPMTQEDVLHIYTKATTTDVNFHHFGPLLRRIDAKLVVKADPATQQALALLQRWDGARVPDASGKFYAGAAVPVFQTWLDQFVALTVGTLLSRDEFASMPAYTGTLQLGYMKNSVNLSMGTKIALRGLQARMGLRPDDVPPYDVLQGQEPSLVMLKALQVAVAKIKPKDGAPLDSVRQPMVQQIFFPENYESVPTASPGERPSLPYSANRGVMQRLAVGDGSQIHSMDTNPPGVSADPASPHYQDQLFIYGEGGFKPLPLTPQKPGPGKAVKPLSKL